METTQVAELLAPAPTREALVLRPGDLLTRPWIRWLEDVWRTLSTLGTAATQAYTTGAFTVTATGFAGIVAGTAQYVQLGRLVLLAVPRLSGTSNAASFTLTGIPAALAPGASTIPPVLAVDNGVQVQAFLNAALGTTTWGLMNGVANSPWTASGTKTLEATALTYLSAA
jgi:hypothetical protein